MAGKATSSQSETMDEVQEAPAPSELPKASLYLARARNPKYSGKTAGVMFNNGQALFEEFTIDKRLGRSVQDVARTLVEMGYYVEPG